MNNLSNLFEKFKTLLSQAKNNKDTIVSVIASNASISLATSDIEVREGVVYINARPAVKNAIFMRKQKIITELKAKLNDQTLKDIR